MGTKRSAREKWLESRPDLTGEHTFGDAGQAALGLEAHRLAQALFRTALDKAPDDLSPLKSLALSQMALGRPEQAVSSLRAYLRRREDFETRFILGELLMGLGRREEALTEFAKAEALIEDLEKKE